MINIMHEEIARLEAEIQLHMVFDRDMRDADKCPTCQAIIVKSGRSASMRHLISWCPAGRETADKLREQLTALYLSQTTYPEMA